MQYMSGFVTHIRSQKIFRIFTWFTRVLLAIGFMPSGLTKLLGNRFTLIGIEDPIGFFFEALYRTGFYWRFLGFMQLFVALLLLIPRTTFLGALMYLPIIINILIIVVAMNFTGTPFVAGLMLMANLYLLFWDYEKMKEMVGIILRK